MTEKEMTNEVIMENGELLQEPVQAAEQTVEKTEQPAVKEKTAEELALEQGYYACCFRSH
ncbi:MAG: hypothetical protein IJA90_11230 [Peptococcaceae bacterium]|nr:hypothetical protein [Peptococcaceae bacterium]